MQRLRNYALLESHIPFLYKDNIRGFKILFHNVRSLHLHHGDVAVDYNMKAADVNIFVETALCNNDCSQAYFIPNLTLFRNDFNLGSRTTYGTAIHVKQNVKILSEPLRCNYNDVEMTLLKVDNPINNLHIVRIYRSKFKVTIWVF